MNLFNETVSGLLETGSGLNQISRVFAALTKSFIGEESLETIFIRLELDNNNFRDRIR